MHIQIVLIHQGAAVGSNAVDGTTPAPWDGPIVTIANAIQDTQVDLILAGHTHRIANFVQGRIPIAEGLNAGASYSVAQLVIHGQDVAWAGTATRVAKNLGVAPRPDVKAIVDDANAQTAVLRNQVIGTQQFDIKRAPSRLFESAMGNMVADAMREVYANIDGAYTNSGGLRADLICTPPSAGEASCEITWGEMFSVLPFSNRTRDPDADRRAVAAGVARMASRRPATRPSPPAASRRSSGLKVTYTCNGTTPVVTGMWKTPQGITARRRRSARPTRCASSPTTSCIRAVTGTRCSARARTCCSPATTCSTGGDYVAANSPVGPVVEGRIQKQ